MVLSRFPAARLSFGDSHRYKSIHADNENEAKSIDGYYLKFSEEIVKEEGELASFCKEIEESWSSDWLAIPWFVENAWFFELLQFEEHLMILIMIPIGLVAAFAIAIALMTSVLRKLGKLVCLWQWGAPQVSVGLVFVFKDLLSGVWVLYWVVGWRLFLFILEMN